MLMLIFPGAASAPPPSFSSPSRSSLPFFSPLCASPSKRGLRPACSARQMETLAAKPTLEKNEISKLLRSERVDSLWSKRKEDKEVLPELLTEFMVDMKCGGCVNAVKSKMLLLDGVRQVDVDLDNQVVKVLGTLSVRSMLDALEQTSRKARLIGQGNPLDFLISSAVAEYKGPTVFGVVRLAQVNMELVRIEASFRGLHPGKLAWAINEFGDLTQGPASTGQVFSPPLGDLGTLEVNENGEAQFSGSKQMLKVSDLIGRSIVVHGTEDKSDTGLGAAVIARSAGIGENYKKLCTCDGVTIWESS